MARKKKITKKPKVRHVWGINPKTRVKENPKKYRRPREKQNLKKRNELEA